MTTFYIVRHGESHGNVNSLAGRDTVVSPEIGSDLTELGVKQAGEIGKRLEKIQFDLAFSSKLLRTKRTAEIITTERNLEVTALEILKERDYGSYGNKLLTLREKMKGLLDNLTEEEKMNFRYSPDIETPEETATRFLTFLRETSLAYPGKNILIVNHGNMMRYLLVKLGYAKYDELPSHSIANTGYIVLESDGVEFFIKETVGVNKK